MRKATVQSVMLLGIVMTLHVQAEDEAAGDVDFSAGENLYQKSCRNCHGPKAQGMASFPKLAGKSAENIAMLLEQYRAGEKIGPNTPLMRPQAANLTDEDITNLANYISSSFK